jgi:acyl-CoA synthetase (AMP-forming)/AMP-acid ligase II
LADDAAGTVRGVTGGDSIGAVFARRAAAHPDRIAVTVVDGPSQAVSTSVTYAELDSRVRARAGELAARFAPGSRLVLGFPTSIGFVEAFLGCLVAGMVAVPVPDPADSRHASARVAAVIRDCSASLVLTGVDQLVAFSDWLEREGLADCPCEGLGRLASRSGTDAGRLPAIGGDALAVLQYSSGSTGEAKGVMLTHANILANLAAYCRCCELTDKDRFGSWLPLHHDLGLFTQLCTALLLGTTSVLMAPSAFARRPAAWLEMLGEHAITVTAAPSFAFDLCLRLVSETQLASLDLSRVSYLFNGSEPIHVPTMVAFTERFGRAGLRPGAVAPGYGLAEATVFVSAKARDIPPTVVVLDVEAAERGTVELVGEGRELAGCGQPVGVEARVVDPVAMTELPGDKVGELWLRGAGVSAGYWRRTELSRRTFGARLAGAGSGWLRTGDLACLVAGQIVVTGRLKEMLVIRGRNVFPQDVEQAARSAHQLLGGLWGAVFGVVAEEERIVVVHEVPREVADAHLPEIAAAIKRRLAGELGIVVGNVVLVDRGTVRRATSGKVQRVAIRGEFLAGRLDARHRELEPAVRELVAAANRTPASKS